MSVLKYKNENNEWITLPNAEVKVSLPEWRYFEATKTTMDGDTPEWGVSQTVKFDFSETGIDFSTNQNWIMVMNYHDSGSNARDFLVSPILANLKVLTTPQTTLAPYTLWSGLSSGISGNQYASEPQFPRNLLNSVSDNIWPETINGYEYDGGEESLTLYSDYLTFDEFYSGGTNPRRIGDKVKLYYLQ